MANILDYLDWRGDLRFDQSPFNEVDGYLLCKLGCPDLTGAVPADGFVRLDEGIRRYFSLYGEGEPRLGALISPMVVPAIRRLPDTPRYAGLKLGGFLSINDRLRNEQFSALTVVLPDGTHFVTFRGTDDTIAAWKEDFLLSVEDEVPAQKDAAAYLLRAADRAPGKLLVGGHSKGGNLAVYAALHAPEALQDRISGIYNYDGPGFRTDILDTPAYRRIRDRVITVLPQHTTVGKLLYHEQNCVIVRSDRSGVAAHDGFHWQVKGTRFLRCQDYSIFSKSFDRAIRECTGRMDREQQRAFIEETFELLTSTGAVTLTDLTDGRLMQAAELAVRMGKSQEVRRFLLTLARKTVSSMGRSLPEAFRNRRRRGESRGDS